MTECARERRQLVALDDRALQDFGASRADAAREGGKTILARLTYSSADLVWHRKLSYEMAG